MPLSAKIMFHLGYMIASLGLLNCIHCYQGQLQMRLAMSGAPLGVRDCNRQSLRSSEAFPCLLQPGDSIFNKKTLAACNDKRQRRKVLTCVAVAQLCAVSSPRVDPGGSVK